MGLQGYMEKVHRPLGKEESFLWDSKILEIHPYLNQYKSVNHNFLIQYLGNKGL
jgi:hypothetical protein